MHRVHRSMAYVIFGIALWYLAASSSCFEIKHSRTIKKKLCQECIISRQKILERGQSIACGVPQNALTVSCDRYERRARAYNFRASFRLTSSRTGKIYEKNACQRGDGIYENSRFVPVGPISSPSRSPGSRSHRPFSFPHASSLSSLFLVHPFPSRNLAPLYPESTSTCDVLFAIH